MENIVPCISEYFVIWISGEKFQAFPAYLVSIYLVALENSVINHVFIYILIQDC